MQRSDDLKRMAHAFDKLHHQLSVLRLHLESQDDPQVVRLFRSMESGLLGPMRKLRKHLHIPYDWRDINEPTPGP